MPTKAKVQPLHALVPQQMFTFVGDTKIYTYVAKEFEAIVIKDLSDRKHLMYNLYVEVTPVDPSTI